VGDSEQLCCVGWTSAKDPFAFDANTLTELYDSTKCPVRDNNGFGYGEKFSVPTVANGYVFVGTQSSLDIFGLNPAACH
jgi:hypothetical protein